MLNTLAEMLCVAVAAVVLAFSIVSIFTDGAVMQAEMPRMPHVVRIAR
jgi:hypothetical protein